MAVKKVYRIYSAKQKSFLSVRGSRKTTWGSWPAQALLNNSDDETLIVQQFELVKTAELTPDRKLII